jgi:3-phytase
VAASNRSDDTVVLYRMDDATRRLAAVGSFKAGIAVYGLCMYRNSRTGTFYVYVDSKQGQLEQWQLSSARGAATARRVRTLDVGGQIEGCVADDALGHLYVAEEQRGIWKYGATPDAGGNRTLVDSTDRKGHLTADVEGLAIAYGPNGTGHLVASSQGAGTFAVYRRGGDNRFLGAFRVGAARGIDGVQDTDGIDVTAAGLGAGYPDGLFVAQDGNNARGNQNFKLVRWPADRFR